MRRAARNGVAFAAAALLMLVAACVPAPEEVTPEPIPVADQGTIEIRVTDPPAADVTSANVTAKNIEVHQVAGEEGEWIMIIEGPVTFDLVKLAEEEEAEFLGSANVTAGSFTQIRMDVDSVVVTIDGRDIPAEVPSGKLKIVRPFNVEGGVKTILTLDFDGSKSVVITGKGKALFKPVVKLLIAYGEEGEEELEEEELEEEVEEEEEEED